MIQANFNLGETKQKKVIIGVAAGIVAIAALIVGIVCIFSGSDEKPTNVNATEITEEEATISIENNITIEETENTTSAEKDYTVIQLEEPKTTKKATQNSTVQTPTRQPTTQKVAQPVTQAPSTAPVTQGKFTEIIENGNNSVKEYSCGAARHHCDSQTSHDFIVYLEGKGCPHCGSHSCKSFYTVDEWGNTCYDQTKCPNYSTKKDPNEYCQNCGKKIGTGSNNTCVVFTVDINCPECGKAVKAHACHSH